MQSRTILAGLALSGAMLVGCEEQPDATPVRTPTADGTGVKPGDQNTYARAQTLIDQVNRHIRAGDYDAAATSLRELESMKSSLPAGMQAQINSLRSQLDSFKAGATAKPPATTTPPNTPEDGENP